MPSLLRGPCWVERPIWKALKSTAFWHMPMFFCCRNPFFGPPFFGFRAAGLSTAHLGERREGCGPSRGGLAQGLSLCRQRLWGEGCELKTYQHERSQNFIHPDTWCSNWCLLEVTMQLVACTVLLPCCFSHHWTWSLQELIGSQGLVGRPQTVGSCSRRFGSQVALVMVTRPPSFGILSAGALQLLGVMLRCLEGSAWRFKRTGDDLYNK